MKMKMRGVGRGGVLERKKREALSKDVMEQSRQGAEARANGNSSSYQKMLYTAKHE